MATLFRGLEELGLRPDHRGKVRETIRLDDREMCIITTDRISAFDCILPGGLPGKGVLLNQLAAFWFRGLEDLLPTHFVTVDDGEIPERLRPHEDVLRGRWMRVRRAERVPIECVVRGYLTGSGWQEYKSSGTVTGLALPPGLKEFSRLPSPIFTPTTKEDEGHDRPVSFEEVGDLVGASLAADLRRESLRIFEAASRHALSRGVILADTKFEFGFIDGRLSLIDEALTPDSSRFWPIETWKAGAPVAWDKQYVRNYLNGLDWDRNPPAPPLPGEVVRQALSLYQQAFDTLTGGRRRPEWAGEAVR